MMNPKRQIVLDTETTGLYVSEGHRIIEIGCIELINRKITKNNYHQYINPERDIDEGAQNVHGISAEFLADKPRFSDIVDDFLAYIKGGELIIHNAPFDVGFLNHELKLSNEKQGVISDYCGVIDTLVMAREKRPGKKNNLDILCKTYEINNTHRELHGALLDAELLAEVYLRMTGGQSKLLLEDNQQKNSADSSELLQQSASRKPTKIIKASQDEILAHQKIIEKMGDKVKWW